MKTAIPPEFFGHFLGVEPEVSTVDQGLMRWRHADGRAAFMHWIDNWMQVNFPDGRTERYEGVEFSLDDLIRAGLVSPAARH